MPHTAGAFAAVDRQSVTDSLTAAASDAEGTDLKKARPVTWVTFDAPEEFGCVADPAVAVRATVAEGLLDDDGQRALVEGATAALTDAVDGPGPMATWVVIDEVPDGNWAPVGVSSPRARSRR